MSTPVEPIPVTKDPEESKKKKKKRKKNKKRPREGSKKEDKKVETKQEKKEEKKTERKRASDWSKESDDAIAKYVAEAKKNPSLLGDAVTGLLAVEKKARLASDTASTCKLALAILELCKDLKNWKALNDNISVLCKRRAQSIEKVIAPVVKRAVQFVPLTPDEETKRALIVVLRLVSAGKIMVELERARLTKQLSAMKEAAGDLDKASEIIQQVAVETIGSMDTREKALFLMDQIRLCLLTKDYIRVEILANKVNKKALNEEKLQDLKLRHHHQMIQYFLHEEEHLNICKAYIEIYNTPSVKADKALWSKALTGATLFAALSPHDSEVSDILARLTREKGLEELTAAKSLLAQHTTKELAQWPLPHAAEWKKQPEFKTESGTPLWATLHKRIVQHNLRMIGGYYQRIPTARLAALLCLSEEKTEEYLCEMVTSRQLFARIDRPAGIVNFAVQKGASEEVKDWSADVADLLSVLERTCHAINKENMMHKVRADAAKKKAARAKATAKAAAREAKKAANPQSADKPS